MPPTTGQLEESLRKLQITDSKAPSTPEQWVPSKYSSDISQYVLVRPPRAPCGHRQLFGFPITKKEIRDMGVIAFQHVQPDEILPDDHTFFVMNSLTFIMLSLGLRVCTTADGKVVGDSDNIPPVFDAVGKGAVVSIVEGYGTRGYLSHAQSSALPGVEDWALARMVGRDPTIWMSTYSAIILSLAVSPTPLVPTHFIQFLPCLLNGRSPKTNK